MSCETEFWIHGSCKPTWILSPNYLGVEVGPNELWARGDSWEPLWVVKQAVFHWLQAWVQVSKRKRDSGETEFEWSYMRCSAMSMSESEVILKNWVSLSEQLQLCRGSNTPRGPYKSRALRRLVARNYCNIAPRITCFYLSSQKPFLSGYVSNICRPHNRSRASTV